MNWKKTKEKLNTDLDLFLRGFKFSLQNSTLEWVRYTNDVCQVIRCEKMSGNHIKLFVFIFTKDINPIGGNLERYTVKGSINYHGQYFWSIDDLAYKNSIIEIKKTINEVAIPWFNTITSSELINNLILEYQNSSTFLLNKNYFKNQGINEISTESNFIYFSKNKINNLLDEYLLPKLNEKGFVKSKYNYAYIRKRKDIFDIIEILPINYGVHFACNGYNWIKELSVSKSKEFTEDSRVMFNGGQLDKKGLFGNDPKIFALKNFDNAVKVLDTIFNNFEKNTINNLEKIRDRGDFIKSIDPIHEYALKAYGLT